MLDTESLVPTDYPHIVLTSKNIPIIAGTTLKVIELVLAQRSYGWTLELISTLGEPNEFRNSVLFLPF
ncbi:MAG: hypothetical protein WBD47_16350 [Phormidesmis sp.]